MSTPNNSLLPAVRFTRTTSSTGPKIRVRPTGWIKGENGHVTVGAASAKSKEEERRRDCGNGDGRRKGPPALQCGLIYGLLHIHRVTHDIIIPLILRQIPRWLNHTSRAVNHTATNVNACDSHTHTALPFIPYLMSHFELRGQVDLTFADYDRRKLEIAVANFRQRAPTATRELSECLKVNDGSLLRAEIHGPASPLFLFFILRAMLGRWGIMKTKGSTLNRNMTGCVIDV